MATIKNSGSNGIRRYMGNLYGNHNFYKNPTRLSMKTLSLWLGLIGISLSVYPQQVAKSITGTNGQFIGFLEFKPSDYGSQKHPLIIFLHGIGERGDGTTQIQNVTANGIANLCARGASMRFTVGGQTSSFVVLSPQLSASYGSWPSWYVEEMIKYAKANLQIDPNRIYVTGLSLGGGGVWTYAFTSYANSAQVAAIAPVCGTDDGWDANACASAGASNLPIWAFHCKDDGTVAYTNTQHVQLTLSWNCGAMTPAPRFTYYLSGGHSGAWINAYDTGHITRPVDSSLVKTGASTSVNFTANPNIYEWFLMQTRSATPVPVVPVAVAGADQSVTLPVATVTLNGSGSYVSGGSISSYQWTNISGPTIPAIASAGQAVTAVSNLTTAGVYKFQLTVTSNTGATSTSIVTVTVNGVVNQTPSSNPGGDQTITLPTSSVSLDGSNSSDPDGNITAYAWTQVSGPSQASFTNANAAKATASNLVQGTYRFQLLVTDNAGATAASTMGVTVNAAPSAPASGTPPVANPTGDQTITLPTNSVSIDGGGSYGRGGNTITAYAWSEDSGPSKATFSSTTASKITVSNLVAGTYRFRLTVTDNAGLTATTTTAVIVNGGSTPTSTTPPVANPTGDQTITLPTNSVSIDGGGSYGRGGNTITAYAWSQDSGPSQATFSSTTASKITVSNLVQGTYRFRLTVTDNAGLTATTTTAVIVNAGASTPANKAPVSNAGTDQSITLPISTAVLNGSASSDPDGTISSYAWSQVSGPSQVNYSAANAVSTIVGNLVQGVYKFQLTVTDNAGATASSTVNVTVNPAVTAPVSTTPPVANPTGDQTITLPTNSVSIDGGGSYGRGGNTITAYAWSQDSGPSQATFSGTTASKITVSNLVQGTYRFRLTVTDNAGLTATTSTAVIVNAGSGTPTPPAGGTGTGLQGDYYNTIDLSGPITFSRTDATVNFFWSGSPGTGIGSDYFSIRWTGQVLAQYSETYTFYTLSDDGVRVWVNGQKIIDNWTLHPSTENSGSITLQAGVKYNIVIEYFENEYDAVIGLSWSSPSTAKAIVPQSQLFPPASAARVVTSTMSADAGRTTTATDIPTVTVKTGIAPNPVAGGQLVRVNINSTVAAPATIEVADANGNLVSTQRISLSAGLTTSYLRTAGLARGLYIVRIVSGDIKQSFKMLVQ